MTDKIEELKQLCEGATERPWGFAIASREALPALIALVEEMECALVHANAAWAGNSEAIAMAEKSLAAVHKFRRGE